MKYAHIWIIVNIICLSSKKRLQISFYTIANLLQLQGFASQCFSEYPLIMCQNRNLWKFWYSARRLNSTFWEVISVFDSWFLVLFLSDIEPYNFVENSFSCKIIRLDLNFFLFWSSWIRKKFECERNQKRTARTRTYL